MKMAVLNVFVNRGSSWHLMDAIAEVSTISKGFMRAEFYGSFKSCLILLQ